MKVKLEKVFRKEVETKYGNKMKVGIKTDKHGDKWLSGFENSEMKQWKEGDEVEIEPYENNGYLNFKTPKSGGGGSGITKQDIRQVVCEENEKLINWFEDKLQKVFENTGKNVGNLEIHTDNGHTVTDNAGIGAEEDDLPF